MSLSTGNLDKQADFVCRALGRFRLAVEQGYFAVVLPKLNIVAVNKLLRPFYRRIIVFAVQIYGPLDSAVHAEKVSAVIRHALCSQSATANLMVSSHFWHLNVRISKPGSPDSMLESFIGLRHLAHEKTPISATLNNGSF
jgi:hypothetical protein